jgi:hypothetical protein
MNIDSRKAQRNGFAHQRATLLFSARLQTLGGSGDWSALTHEGTEPPADAALQRLKAKVRAGLGRLRPLTPAAL